MVVDMLTRIVRKAERLLSVAKRAFRRTRRCVSTFCEVVEKTPRFGRRKNSARKVRLWGRVAY